MGGICLRSLAQRTRARSGSLLGIRPHDTPWIRLLQLMRTSKPFPRPGHLHCTTHGSASVPLLHLAVPTHALAMFGVLRAGIGPSTWHRLGAPTSCPRRLHLHHSFTCRTELEWLGSIIRDADMCVPGWSLSFSLAAADSAAAAADSAAVALGLLVALPPLGVLLLLARPEVVVAVARRLAVVAAVAAPACPRNSPSPVRPGGTLQWAMPMDRAR